MLDVIVVGGGVVGCSILDKLVRKGVKTLLIENQPDVATGCSKANSGLVHAGFDSMPGTLKAKFNVRGNELMYAMAKSLGVNVKKCGAVVVGGDSAVVKELHNRGVKNGVKDLQILDRAGISKLVPNAAKGATHGLYAPSAGIISPYMLTIALAEHAVINGGQVLLNTEITKIIKTKNGYKVTCGKKSYECKHVVNAAGYGYNDVAKLIGSEQYNIDFRRGEYMLLDSSTSDFVKLTVFPLPTKAGKGILVSPTIDGGAIVGPTSYTSDASTRTTVTGQCFIKEKASQSINDVPYHKNIRSFAGIRTIIGHDFVVQKSEKMSNVINIAGICSPGLVSSPAIAEYVVEQLLGYTQSDIQTIDRKPYINMKTLSEKQKQQLILQDSDFGQIVCKCENVKLGEVKQAINSPLKITSTDAIKRRVRAGMGKCQGGFCLTKVIEAIAEGQNIKPEKVLKEYKGSNIYLDKIN